VKACWLLTLALTPVLAAQVSDNPHSAGVRYVPALAYGPKIWSVIKLSNVSGSLKSVEVDVFNEDGTRVPMARSFEVSPGGTVEVRIDAKADTDQPCWARVAELPTEAPAGGLDIHAAVEVLRGDALEEFSRAAHVTSAERRWISPTAKLVGRDLYFLNVAENPTVVTFCAARDARADACRRKGTPATRIQVSPNHWVSVHVRKLSTRYFVTESSSPGAAVLALFSDGPGDRQVFSSHSSIQFDESTP
jgi:hypothetical protein